MNKVKIFVTYHSYDFPVIRSDVFQPIMGGNQGAPLKEGFIGDDTGDNISRLNKNYAELTAHYWILKNYLPTAKEDYIGVFHYRRVLGFTDDEYHHGQGKGGFTQSMYYRYFIRFLFNNWTEDTILLKIKDYDVIGPYKNDLMHQTVRTQFDSCHRHFEMDKALEALGKVYPEYMPYAKKYFEEYETYICSLTIMKRQLLQEYFDWQVNILKEFAFSRTWDEYSSEYDVRMPAFIMERFYNIWVRYQIDKNKIKVLDLPNYQLEYNLSPAQRVAYINRLAERNASIEDDDIDSLASQHHILNRIIRILVSKKKYFKLLGDPKSFFFDSRSIMLRLIGAFYK